jgi:hypothetical protein
VGEPLDQDAGLGHRVDGLLRERDGERGMPAANSSRWSVSTQTAPSRVTSTSDRRASSPSRDIGRDRIGGT